jgi:GYF domain
MGQELSVPASSDDMSSAGFGGIGSASSSVSGLPSYSTASEIDIYDTSCSQALKDLLSTMHDDDDVSVKLNRSGSSSFNSTSFNVAAPEFVPTFAAVPPAVAAATLATKVWWYKDPQGITRGPFSTADMRVWSERGYFTGSLMIARDESGPFAELQDIYTDCQPFTRLVDIREFNQKLTIQLQ